MGWVRTWDGTGCEFNSWQCRIYISYPMFKEPLITWVSSCFSGYIWFDTKIVLKKNNIWLNFDSLINLPVSFSFILNSHERGIGPTIMVLDWLQRSKVKVFVSLCSYSTGGRICVYRDRGLGGIYYVWRIGFSKHTKEGEGTTFTIYTYIAVIRVLSKVLSMTLNLSGTRKNDIL